MQGIRNDKGSGLCVNKTVFKKCFLIGAIKKIPETEKFWKPANKLVDCWVGGYCWGDTKAQTNNRVGKFSVLGSSNGGFSPTPHCHSLSREAGKHGVQQ